MARTLLGISGGESFIQYSTNNQPYVYSAETALWYPIYAVTNSGDGTIVLSLGQSGVGSTNWTSTIVTSAGSLTNGAGWFAWADGIWNSGTNHIASGGFIGDGRWLTNVSGTGLTNSGVLHVDVAGSDATAQRGNPARPWRTVAAALTNAISGDVVLLGYGTHTFTNQLQPAAGVTLAGQGIGQSTLYYPAQTDLLPVALPGASIVVLTNNLTFRDFTFQTYSNGASYAIWFPFANLAGNKTNITFHNVDVVGMSDIFNLIGSTQIRAENSTFRTRSDTVVGIGTNDLSFTGCTWLGDGWGGEYANGPALYAGTMTIRNCFIQLTNLSNIGTPSYGVSTSFGAVKVDNVTFDVTRVPGYTYDVYGDPGTLTVAGGNAVRTNCSGNVYFVGELPAPLTFTGTNLVSSTPIIGDGAGLTNLAAAASYTNNSTRVALVTGLGVGTNLNSLSMSNLTVTGTFTVNNLATVNNGGATKAIPNGVYTSVATIGCPTNSRASVFLDFAINSSTADPTNNATYIGHIALQAVGGIAGTISQYTESVGYVAHPVIGNWDGVVNPITGIGAAWAVTNSANAVTLYVNYDFVSVNAGLTNHTFHVLNVQNLSTNTVTLFP